MNDNMTPRNSMNRQRRAAFAATFASFAGIALGLYAGIVAKNGDTVRQVEWKVQEQTLASRGTDDIR
jgi:hypothetical protein